MMRSAFCGLAVRRISVIHCGWLALVRARGPKVHYSISSVHRLRNWTRSIDYGSQGQIQAQCLSDALMYASVSRASQERYESWMLLFLIVVFTLLNFYDATSLLHGPKPLRSLNSQKSSGDMNYSYINHDHPRNWPVGPIDKVYMAVEETVHYAVDEATGLDQWNSTLPRGGGILHLGPNGRAFSVSLFHELRCLDVLRVALMNELGRMEHSVPPPLRDEQPPVVRHCMGYLRQMMLCRASTGLENVKEARGLGLTKSDITHTCNDWSAVFGAAEQNYVHWKLRSSITT